MVGLADMAVLVVRGAIMVIAVPAARVACLPKASMVSRPKGSSLLKDSSRPKESKRLPRLATPLRALQLLPLAQ